MILLALQPLLPVAASFLISVFVGVLLAVLQQATGPESDLAARAPVEPKAIAASQEVLGPFVPTRIVRLDGGGLVLFSYVNGHLISRFQPPSRTSREPRRLG